MNTKNLNVQKLRFLTLSILTALSSGTVAQQTEDQTPSKEQEIEKIQVLGSNIRVDQDTGALPVTTISSEEIDNTGAISGAELLAEIPQQGEVNFSSERAAGGVNDARGDVSSFNLRGIGTGNTLVLLNGRRLVTHPGTQSENFVPVTTVNSNTLPVRGLKRVEVLRDGAAAIYGSDAIAGVVNYALKDDYKGSEIRLSYGTEEVTPRDTLNISGATGFYLDSDEKTHVTMSAGYYDRAMLMASEKPFSATSDLRGNQRFPQEVRDSIDLINLTGATPWLEGRTRVLDNDSGWETFHLQPETFSGCVNTIGNGDPIQLHVPGVCVDAGGQPRNDRYDRNTERSLSSGVKRANVYSLLTHDMDDFEFYAEALYYYAKSERIREMSGLLNAQDFTIAANAFYNPFNAEVRTRDYRPVDVGPRNIEVTDNSYRLLAGLRGYLGEWDFDSAILYSKATTEDQANRINTQAFQRAVNSTDKNTAYNIFSGGNVNNVNVGDPSKPSQAVIDSFMVNIIRDSETELALADFKASKSDLFELPAGDVGMALGVEYRYESFSDVRSDDLNGTNKFLDIVGGSKTVDYLASQVLGSSPTPDQGGSRNTLSAFVELAVPLLADLPFVEYLDAQIAARYERFSDVGDVVKPKLALSWTVNEYVHIRAAYAEGFKAPALPQVVANNVARSNSRNDIFAQSRYAVVELRNGGANLKPEESESLSWGIVLQPFEGLTLTADWWQLDQQDTVGILHADNILAYDQLLRFQSGNGDVNAGTGYSKITRDPDSGEVIGILNEYINLQDRESAGLDLGLTYDVETDIGDFTFKANAAKLTKFNQVADDMSAQVIAAQKSDNQALVDALKYRGTEAALQGIGSLIEVNGRPKWRVTSSLGWKKGAWGAGIRYRYVGSFIDTSLNDDNNGDDYVYRVHSFSRIDLYANYRLPKKISSKTKVTVGVRNLGDKSPPIADETFGYNSSVHSSMGRYFYFNISKKF